MPFALLPLLKGFGGFLWKYKFAVAAVLIVLLIWWQHDKIKDMKVYQDALKTANAAYVETLKTVRDSAAAQIAALDAEMSAEKERDEKTNQIILEVEKNEEQVDCAVPVFVRDAFERM